jgi:hypothetical protein
VCTEYMRPPIRVCVNGHNLIYISVTFASSGMEFSGSPPDGRKQNYENGVA